MEHEYPQIEQRAKTEGAEIAWGDESGVSSSEYGGRGYAPSGQSPEICPSQRKRERVNYTASVSNQGTVQFMLYTCKLEADLFIRFCERLIAQRKRKLFWIVDRYPVHQQGQVKQNV